MGKRRRSPTASSNRAAKRPKRKTVFADIDDILYHINSEEIGQPLYLIKWPSSWEPARNVIDCGLALARFEAGNNLNSHNNTTPYKFKDPAETKYEVYKILDKREKNVGQVEYLVEWKLSWELKGDIEPIIIQNYHDKRTSDMAEQNVSIEDKRFNTTAFGDDEHDVGNEIEANAVGFDNNENGDGCEAADNGENGEENEVAAVGFDEREDGDGIGEENGVFVNQADYNVSSGYCSEQQDSSEQQNTDSNSSGTDVAGDFESDNDSDNSDDDDDVVDKIIAIKGDKFNFGFVAKLTNGEHGFVDRKVAAKEFPQKVIEFYQSRINFLVPNIPAHSGVKSIFSTFFNNTYK